MPVHRLHSATPAQPATERRHNGKKDRQSAAETISRLQRGILRMSLAYHGQNPELDEKLKELGGLLRSGQRDARLRELIDQIVETIVSIDHMPRIGSASAERDLLLTFLDQVTVPESIRNDIDSARKLIIEKRQSAEVIAGVEEAARAISAELDASLNRGDNAGTARDALVELLERVPIGGKVADDATALKRKLLKLDSTDDIKPCVAAVAELIRSMRAGLQREIDGLSEFLRGTARRLQECEDVMSMSREMHADSSRDAVQLSETVGAEITVLREDVTTSDNLETLKITIESKLANIDAGLNKFVETQKERSLAANDTIENMVHQLKHLEEETRHLREDLAEQHARILVDPLTGVLNRTGYSETAGKQFARWKRYGGALSLAVIDLDLFKEINDCYGHAAGDKVLARVAENLNTKIRDSDILCRYGGEEFVLILPETSADDAVTLLDKLRKHIEACAFRYRETPVPVTMSCGIAQFHARDTLDDVFDRADRAMYTAKRQGRNQVCSEIDLPPNAA